MTVDLHRALGTLADGGPHRTAPTDQLLARVHRRRAARAATTGAVSMGTVAAVAIGAVALNGRGPDDGPATVGATDTPTDDPGTVPPAPGRGNTVTAAAFNCGDSAPATFVSELAGVSLDVDLPDAWTEGDVFTLPGQVDATGDAEALSPPAVIVALMSEGRVRASGGTILDHENDGRLALGTPFAAEIIIEPCGDERLPAGEYTAVASLLYDVDDGRGGMLQVSAPITVTQWTADAAEEAAAEAAVADVIAASQAGTGGSTPGTCGSNLAPGAFEDELLRPVLSMTAMPQNPRPRAFYGHSLVENIGEQTFTIQDSTDEVAIVLTRDGVVVATGGPVAPGGETDPHDVAPGSSVGLATAHWFDVCGLPGSAAPDVPLPAGDYQAWVVLTTTVTEVEGPAAGTSREVTVVSDPVDVTYH